MENEWKWVPVSQVAEPVLGGTPKRSEPGYWGGNIKWAAAKDIVAAQGRRVYQTEETITPLGVAQSAAKILPKGTVVITARGTVGAVAQLGDDMAFNQTCYGLVAKPEIDQDFLYYAIKATLRTAYTLSYGTVFDTITKKTFEQWRIPLPLLVEQRAIAHFLGTLDDKIELNQRMNETLEAIAQTIFKSWFVDFDPVIDNALKAGKPIPDELEERAARRRVVIARARAEGRPAGLPDYLARLFPDEFEESELGWIPRGWRVRTLKEMVCVTSGKRPKSRSDTRDCRHRVPLFGGGGPMGYVETPLYEQPIILTGRVGTLGMVFRVTFPCWPSDNTLVILPREALWYEFIFHTVRGFDFESLNRGSTQPLVTQSDLEKQPD
jgi:type I restriction enzyme S subunit